MIRPEELRIGNIVQVKNNLREETGTQHIISKLSREYCNVESDIFKTEYGQKYKFIFPILLTEEWLWALGSEINYRNYICDRFKLIWKDAYKYWYVVDKESLIYLTKIEFVHEWQNFVYAMNSEELTIKQ